MDPRETPDVRARELLRSVLPETQWTEFSKTGILEVAGRRAKYRICAREMTQLVDSKTRRPFFSACLQLSIPAPVHDRIIAEYMLIRNDEDLYWRTANLFPVASNVQTLMLFLTALFDVILLTVLLVQLAR